MNPNGHGHCNCFRQCFRCYFFCLLFRIRSTKCQSASLTLMFLPGHRFWPICDSKRSHLIFSGLCDLPEPVIGHLHFHDLGCRKSFSNCVCLAVQSEHTIFVRPLDSLYLRRASYGNFKCPRSPHSLQQYFWTSFGDMPLLQQTAQTRFRPRFLAFSKMFWLKASFSSSC